MNIIKGEDISSVHQIEGQKRDERSKHYISRPTLCWMPDALHASHVYWQNIWQKRKRALYCEHYWHVL